MRCVDPPQRPSWEMPCAVQRDRTKDTFRVIMRQMIKSSSQEVVVVAAPYTTPGLRCMRAQPCVQVVDTLAPLLPRAAVGTPKGPDAQADLKAKLLKDDTCVPLGVPLSQLIISATAQMLCCAPAWTPSEAEQMCSLGPLILCLLPALGT